MSSLKAIVKSVTSGDTLVLRNKVAGPGQPPKERILHIADVSSPRMGTSTRDDEPWAFECRENLRKLLVGKEVTFTPTHALPPSNTDAEVQRDFGTVEFNGVDLSSDLLRSGWAKTKEGGKREPSEEDLKKRELENEAKSAGRGIWKPEGPPERTFHTSMPQDSAAFLKEWKDQMIDGIVEQVRDGSTLRIRLLLSESLHQMVVVSLAGVRCPKVGGKDGEAADQYGEEAKFFTESRLLQRLVRVKLLSLPAPTALPFASTASGAAPPPASMFIGIVMHPNGNVAEHLVANCLARVVDWHAGMLAAGGFMERLRTAESTAKEKRQFLYSQHPASAAGKAHANVSGSSARAVDGKAFDGQVVRVWSGDQISVVEKDTNKERRLQLSSTRAPKATDPKQAFYANEAREFLRKRLIGKTVRVHVDFIKPAEGAFEERECATVRYGNNHSNIAEQLIDKGLATVVRHKRDDEDRSPDYDKLMAAEQSAINEKRGLHTGKEGTVPKLVNASETFARASQFLSGFKRQKRIPALVDYVAAGSRFKLLVPRDNVTLTFVLAGIRAPKTARNEHEKSDPYGPESAEFASRRYMQREVEIEVEGVDKSGGFIGAMFINKTENVAITLVREGLASIHAYSAESLSWAKALEEAEAEAKKERKNIWINHTEEVAPEQPEESVPSKVEFIDVILSDIRTDPFEFSVQILNTEGIASLEKLMSDFSQHYKAAPSPPGFAPKAQDLISAKFSDGAWYRAKVLRSSPAKREAQVVFIDYGNRSTLPFSDTRPLDAKFKSLPAQAHDARLSFVKMVPSTSEYFPEAIERFKSRCEGIKLIANIDYKEGNHLLHLRLIDPADSASRSGTASINADLVREGFASVDRKGVPAKYIANYPAIMSHLGENVKEAKRERAGMFEFGDVEEDD